MPFIVPLMGTPAGLSGIDAGNEAWSMSLYGLPLDDTNWVAQQALWTTLYGKIRALQLGAVKTSFYGNETHYAYSQPTNGAAREIALRISAKDDTTQERFTYQIPAINPATPVYVLNVDAKDVVRTDTPSAITDLISAFNAFAVSPVTGNQLVLYGLRVVRGKK